MAMGTLVIRINARMSIKLWIWSNSSIRKPFSP